MSHPRLHGPALLDVDDVGLRVLAVHGHEEVVHERADELLHEPLHLLPGEAVLQRLAARLARAVHLGVRRVGDPAHDDHDEDDRQDDLLHDRTHEHLLDHGSVSRLVTAHRGRPDRDLPEPAHLRRISGESPGR